MLQGNWWGVNNPTADDMSCYPNIKKMFTSKNCWDVAWINAYWKFINLEQNYQFLTALEKKAKERVKYQ